MKIFISWSGQRSRKTAELLREWLPLINQDFDPFVSGEDISKGGNWGQAIIDELNQAKFGIVCVTPHNHERPWLLFEAGALSRQVGNEPSLVAPVMIGFEGKRDLPPPLGRFQTTLPDAEDMFKLVKSLNAACDRDRRRPLDQLGIVFEMTWGSFERQFQEIENSDSGDVVRPRSDTDVLAEVLDIVRSLQQRSESPNIAAAELLNSDIRSRTYFDRVRQNAATVIRGLGNMAGLHNSIQQLGFSVEDVGVDETGGSAAVMTLRDTGDAGTADTRLNLVKTVIAGLGLDVRTVLYEPGE